MSESENENEKKPLPPFARNPERAADPSFDLERNLPRDPVTGKVDWPAVLGPKKLSYVHKYIAHLAALGKTQRKICEITGMSGARMTILVRSPIMVVEIDRVRKELFESEDEKRTKLMVPKAMQVIDEVLNDKQARSSLRTDVAFKVLERVHGKPKQHIQAESNTIKDLFELLNTMRPVGSSSPAREEKEVSAETIETPGEEVPPKELPAPSESDLEDGDIGDFLEESLK